MIGDQSLPDAVHGANAQHCCPFSDAMPPHMACTRVEVTSKVHWYTGAVMAEECKRHPRNRDERGVAEEEEDEEGRGKGDPHSYWGRANKRRME